jgi:hypothetical protein
VRPIESRPTLQTLCMLLRYEPDTGHFYYRTNGKLAGSLNGQGYWRLSHKGLNYPAHVVAYLFMTGEWPTMNIDHINGVRTDNRWANLRMIGNAKNMQNLRKARADNKSGLLGVSTPKNSKKFIAQISINGRQTYLGTFVTPEEAHEAYLAAKRIHHEACTI